MSRTKWSGAERRAVKEELAARDGACCFYCSAGFAADFTDATLDHLMPYSLFPRNLRINLVLACYSCNQTKADVPPHEFLSITTAELAAWTRSDVATIERVLAAPAKAPNTIRGRVLVALRRHRSARALVPLAHAA